MDKSKIFNKNKVKIISPLIFAILLFGGLFFTIIQNSQHFNNYQSEPIYKVNGDNFPASLTWNGIWGGSANEWGREIAFDNDGNIFIVGSTNSYGAGGADMLLLKYDKNKNLIWYQTWGYAGYDNGNDLVIDSAGNIFCVGITTEPGINNLALVKFLPNGDKDWNRTWSDGNPLSGSGIALDSNEEFIYVVGRRNTGKFLHDPILLKFHHNGTLTNITKIWEGTGYDEFFDIEIDDSDNLYCVGNNNSLPFIGKYDSNGNLIWNSSLESEFYYGGYYEALQFDSSGNILCVGAAQNKDSGYYDFLLTKYHPNRTQAWNKTRIYNNMTDNEGKDLFIDNITGDIYCTGKLEYINFNSTLAKFYPNGTKAWNITKKGMNYGITMNQSSGMIYCTGRIFNGSYNLTLSEFLEPPIIPVLDMITPSSSTTGIINLNWTESYRASKYLIYRATSEITSLTGLTPIAEVLGDSNYIDIVSDDGEGTYYYVVVASNTVGNTSISNCQSVTYNIPTTPPIPGFELFSIVLTIIIGLLIFKNKKKAISFTKI